MKLGDIYFPKPLLDALINDRLVVFAGAGVSMGEPANLPNFSRLTDAIAQRTGKDPEKNETKDQFLGRLKCDGVKVHECVAEELRKNNPEPTELHRNLLCLFSEPELVRTVTTNFDFLFERAAEEMFDLKPELFRAPALPLGSEFRGIVHVHGSVARPKEMILTDEDFGRAYLVESEGWARRFLVELFRSFTVLFIGYSHDDTIMNYLASALPASEEAKRFALDSPDKDSYEKWQILGIEPIAYHLSDNSGHRALYEGIAELVKYARRSLSDWQIKIKELAEKDPSSLDQEEMGVLGQVLSHEIRTRFFVEAASSAEWIKWLDDNKYLDNLFKDIDLNERDVELAHWLIREFARNHPNHLFFLIGLHNSRVNPDFWHRLARFIGQDRQKPWDKDILSRWICLLLAKAPADVDDVVLLWLGERCIEHELFEDIVEIFDTMSRSYLRLEGYAWPGTDTEDPSPPVTALLEPASNHFKINSLWKKGLKLNLDQVAEPLLLNVIRHLETQHRRLSVWGTAWPNRNPASSRRVAIEPDEQNTQPEPWDVLIDAARDCLEWLVSDQPETVAQLCNRLTETEVPLLRRLALHTLLVREDLTPDEKIDWLLPKMDLDDTSVHHELFRAVTRNYPDAGPQRRRKVVEVVLAYSFPNEQDENKDFSTAEVHIDWLNSLHTALPVFFRIVVAYYNMTRPGFYLL